MATAVHRSPTSMAVISSQQYAQVIDDACTTRSSSRLMECVSKDNAADFVHAYLESELLWWREQHPTSPGPSTPSPRPAAPTVLHAALCRACRGGTVTDGVPSVGLGVLSVAWKHLMVPIFASSHARVQSLGPDERAVLARLLEFILELVVQDVLSHNWEAEKDVQLSKFFASYLVAVVKAFPSITTENSIAAQLFHFHGVVAAAVGTSHPEPSSVQLMKTILVRIEHVVQCIGAAADIPLTWKQSVLREFVENGSLTSTTESEGEGEDGSANENQQLFHGVMANILVTFLQGVPLDDTGSGIDTYLEWFAALVALLPSSLLDSDVSSSPLLLLAWADDGTGPSSHRRRFLVRLLSNPQASLMLFLSGGEASTASSASFAERWAATTARLLACVAHAPAASVVCIASLMHCTSHPTAAAMAVSLWTLGMALGGSAHSAGGPCNIPYILVSVFAASVAHLIEPSAPAEAAVSSQPPSSLERLRRMSFLSGSCIKLASQRDAGLVPYFQQLLLVSCCARSQLQCWVVTSVSDALSQWASNDESPAQRSEELDAAQFFQQPLISLSDLCTFDAVCGPLGIHCNLTEGTTRQLVALGSETAHPEALRCIIACGASHDCGALRLPQTRGGLEALVALTKLAVKARQTSRQAAIAGLVLLSRAPDNEGVTASGVGDHAVQQLRSTSRLLAAAVCPVAVLESTDAYLTITGLDAVKVFAQSTQLVMMQELALDEGVVDSLVRLLQPSESDDLNEDATVLPQLLLKHQRQSSQINLQHRRAWWQPLEKGVLNRKRPRSPEKVTVTTVHSSLGAGEVAPTVHTALPQLRPLHNVLVDQALAALIGCESTLQQILLQRQDALSDAARQSVEKAVQQLAAHQRDLRSVSVVHGAPSQVTVKREVEVHEIDDD